MQKDLNQQIDDILDSTKGSKRARPSRNLLEQIEKRIEEKEEIIIPIRRLRLVAAAAAVLVLINCLALNNYLQSEVTQKKQSSISLISDYKLYE